MLKKSVATKSIGLFAILLSLFTHSALQAANKFPLGMNTNEVTHLDSSVPFVNLFKMSLPFDEANNKLTRGNIQYDHNGWPKQLNGGQAGTNLLHWVPVGTLPEGNYTVLYDGQGQIEYADDAKLLSRSPGKDIIHIAARNDSKRPNDGLDKFIKVTLIIKQSVPQNYLKNIRVLIPGGICARNPFQRVNSANQCGGDYQAFEQHHERIIFNPDYLKFMRGFKTIRFMNMSGITRNSLSSWNQMPRMQQATWAGREGRRGAPLEVMVSLANKLNANAWLNIPEQANDDLVRRYAQFVKARLRPNLKVYLEYTNEAWNPAFTAAKFMQNKGVALKLDPLRHNAGHRFYVQRALQIFRIWKQVYGNSPQLVRVLGAWSANHRLTPLLLDHKNAHKNVDAIAIAPYFFVHKKVESRVNSVPSVFQLLQDDTNPYSLNNVSKMIKKQVEYTKKYNIGLLAYEGGQHLYSPGTRSTKDFPNPFFIGANRAHTMEQMYVRFLEDWRKSTSGSLFVLFSSPRTYQAYGSWGVKEHINQPAAKAPKYRAILQFL